MSASPTTYSNHELAEIFQTIASLLEIKGEVIYKILAYRKAADSLENLASDATAYWREGRLDEIPGVGKAIAEKVDELLSTGKLEFLERLKEEVPISLMEVLAVPGCRTEKGSSILEAEWGYQPGRARAGSQIWKVAQPSGHG